MNRSTRWIFLGAIVAGLALASAAEPANTALKRVGIYDSRAIAFAHFWTEASSRERDAVVTAAKAAHAAGDAVRAKELEAQLRAAQRRSHLQVFSTVPADEALAALKEKFPALQQEFGVTRFVSKWDEAALRDISLADRVDVTDRLVREFNPDAKRLKTIEQMKAGKPLPLAEAIRLADAGQL